MSVNAAPIERLLAYRFRDRGLLAQAFVHDSYLHENPQAAISSNERLEFLGDAWLDFVVAEELFRRFPDAPEGQLTKMRAAAVQASTLARVTRELGLAEHLCLGRGEDQTGGRERASNLAGLYEAVVGAIFIDGGENRARRFVIQTLEKVLGEAATVETDYKSALQEFCQARRWEPPSYRVEATEGPPHSLRFTVEVWVQRRMLGRGQGQSRREAEKSAARVALEVLQQPA